jgi:biopolymer transport protein ExbD/biopolymer transport protein TolR
MKQIRQPQFDDINITPLTDIFLVLLIIMMVVAPMLDFRGLDMLVSVDQNPGRKSEEKYVQVAIAADGQFKVGDAAVGPDDLASAIREEAAAKPDGLVIQADPESNHGALAHAIDSAQAAGITSVSVVESTPPLPPSPKPPAKKKR